MDINKKDKKEGGFIQLIIVIVLALFLMRYYGIGVDGALEWIKNFFFYIADYFRR